MSLNSRLRRFIECKHPTPFYFLHGAWDEDEVCKGSDLVLLELQKYGNNYSSRFMIMGAFSESGR